MIANQRLPLLSVRNKAALAILVLVPLVTTCGRKQQPQLDAAWSPPETFPTSGYARLAKLNGLPVCIDANDYYFLRPDGTTWEKRTFQSAVEIPNALPQTDSASPKFILHDGNAGFGNVRDGQFQAPIQADGSGLRQLTNFDKDTFTASWSPDGESAVVGSTSTKSLWRLDTSRLNTQQNAEALEDPAKAGFLDVLTWSPSGKQLAGRVQTESQVAQPAVWDLAHRSLRKLDLADLRGNGISFLPDSRRVLFNSGTGIVLVDLADEKSRRVGDSLPTDDCRLSRDGRTLLIQHRVFDSDIWLMEFAK